MTFTLIIKFNDISINVTKGTSANTLKQLNDVRAEKQSKFVDCRSTNDGDNNDLMTRF